VLLCGGAGVQGFLDLCEKVFSLHLACPRALTTGRVFLDRLLSSGSYQGLFPNLKNSLLISPISIELSIHLIAVSNLMHDPSFFHSRLLVYEE
jgi:hypothetical protein